jgi:hypothetical protein
VTNERASAARTWVAALTLAVFAAAVRGARRADGER